MSKKSTRKHMGEGDTAIANYVREFHPEIVEAAKQHYEAFKEQRFARMQRGLERYREEHKGDRVAALLKRLADLGVTIPAITIMQDTQNRAQQHGA